MVANSLPPPPSPPANYSNGSPRLINDTRTSCSIHRGSPIISVEVSARMCRAIYPRERASPACRKIVLPFVDLHRFFDPTFVERQVKKSLSLIFSDDRFNYQTRGLALRRFARGCMQRLTSRAGVVSRESYRCAHVLLGQPTSERE